MTLVEQLVRTPSLSGSETEVANVLIAEMTARGFEARLDDAGNALGTIGQGPLQVYLIGHMDTVPGDLPIVVADGTLFGRGSVDAKGPLATCVEAASAFGESSVLTLTLVGCVREESDSAGARHVLESLPAPDLALVAEPSGWDAITLGYKGSLPVRYRLQKAAAHHGAPETTAAEDAVAFYANLCAAFPNRGVGFDDVSIRLTAIRSELDASEGRAEAVLDVRTPPNFGEQAFREAIRKAAPGARIELGEYTPAVLRGKRNAWVRALLAGIRSQGGRPLFKRKTGTSDMNLFQAWDVPLVTYGPGDSSLDHTPRERLSLEEYERAIAVLRHGLRELEQTVALADRPAADRRN